MTSIRRIRIFNILLLLVLVFTLSNCVSNDYDLKKGINTDMTIGGDSLSLPIGKTNQILLGSLLDKQNLDILTKSSSGGYSLQFKDSTGFPVDVLSPVNFSIAPISIPLTTSVASIVIPSFTISPINISSNLPFPTIDFSSINVDPINSISSKQINLSNPSSVKKQLTSNNSLKSKSVKNDYSTGLIKYNDNKIFKQSTVYNYPPELKKINAILLKKNIVTLTFDKTDINNLGFTTQHDTIKNFEIDFPAEYVLSSPTGQGASVSGSSFIIKNAVLSPSQGIFTATFKIDRLNLSNYDQSLNLLNYSKDIPYNIDYSFVGTTSDPNLLNSRANISMSLTAGPAIDDMDIVTNDFLVSVPVGSSAINQTIQLPPEISKVNSVTFNDGATLQLNIADPGITPFDFNAGNCVIQLPQKLIFKPYTGLNTSTNQLTIPYNQLFGTKTIGISGMNINQSVPVGSSSITINDNFSYSINGLKIASHPIMVNTINNMNNKTINVTGTVSTLTVSNSSIVTNSITINVPDQSTYFDVNQFVSNDVKKIYTLTPVTPPTLNFGISIANLPSAIDSVFFRDFTIQFPTFLKFNTGSVNTQNQLVLNEGFKVSKGFIKSLTIQKIDFGTAGKDLTSGVFNLHEKITMTGNAYIKGKSLNTNDISNAVISPTLTVGNIQIGLIEAQITPTIQPVTKDITLNFPDLLTRGNTVLDIVNPVLTLQIGNTMGIPANIDLTFTPKRNGSAITAGIIKTSVSIAAASVLGQTTWSNYWISNYCKGYSAGYDTINVALPNLLRSVPDQLEIIATPTVTGTKQTVDLNSQNNQLNLKYSVNVPLSFGKDFVIEYNDTITDLQKQLTDILKMTNNVEIIAFVENSIPLELSLNATALNSSKSIINDISISSPDKIKPCNANGTSQTSKIKIALSEKTSGALKLLDNLKLKISAKSNSTVAGIALNTNQYIKLELRIRIPKGINITNNK
jgi:hypothetical protein